MSEEDRQSQVLELEAFESVLREGKLTKSSDWNDGKCSISGFVVIDSDSTENREVVVQGVFLNGEKFSNQLKMLPPVRLHFTFPFDYPSQSSPQLILKSDWMTNQQIMDCDEKMAEICEEYASMTVLYICYEAIVEKIHEMATKVINLNDASVLQNNENETVEILYKRIMGESEKALEENFANSLYDCEVCYGSFMGHICIKFSPCQHVFCQDCTFGYFKSICQGLLSKPLQCLADRCTSEASHSVIREALSEELFAKYENSLLEKALQEMDDVVQCPRESCQKIAYLSDPSKHLVECSYCSFSFCNLCKQTFHGVSPCKFKKDEKKRIIEMFEKADEEDRQVLYKKYGGEATFKKMVEKFLNDEWLDTNSKPCPKCSVSIEKNEGCHKMHCTKCDTYFCWLCNSKLDKVDPYAHFRGDGTCSGRLFEGANHDDDFFADGDEFFAEFEDDDDDDDDDFDVDDDEIQDFIDANMAFDNGSDVSEGEEEYEQPVPVTQEEHDNQEDVEPVREIDQN